MYEARKICNLLIERNHTHQLTNLRLNKLLYFIHGWSLTSRPDGLIRNHFLAWDHGPVIRPVFDSFKIYGNGPIKEPAKFLDYTSGENRTVPYDDISADDAELIKRIFANYDRYTTNELYNIAHQPGGPWHIVYTAWSKDNTISPRIPNELIRRHFLTEAGGGIRH
jgi:uncharacterized phage-associated protein